MDILAQACELGLVTRNEVERGIAVERPGAAPGRSTVTLRGRVVAVVHEYGPGSMTARERAALAVLAEDDLVPALLPSTDGRLWTTSVPGRSLADLGAADSALADSTLTELTAACVALGAALAAVHRTPVQRATAPAALRSIEPLGGASARRVRGTALGAEIQHVLDADLGLQTAAETLRRRWSDRHWTLGRIEADHVVVDTVWRARFTDLECAGPGNPDWDVAACLAMVARVADCTDASVAWLSEHLWNSYRRAGGPGQVHPQIQAMHAIDAAWRSADPNDGGPDADADVHWWLDRAHRLVTRRAAA